MPLVIVNEAFQELEPSEGTGTFDRSPEEEIQLLWAIAEAGGISDITTDVLCEMTNALCQHIQFYLVAGFERNA